MTYEDQSQAHLNGKLGTPLPLLLDGFPLHATGETLLIPAVLAAVSLAFVYRAVLVLPAGIGQVFPYRPLEKSFASFTAAEIGERKKTDRG